MLQDLRFTNMAKRLFEQPKHSLLNIECGNTEYIYWSSCEATALTKKYQKKLAKITELVNIVTLALAVFEMSVPEALNNGKVDEWEFGMLQTDQHQL